MRLLNTLTLELEEFSGSIPAYAILSHTWGQWEFSFNDFQEGAARSKLGFAKIEAFCAVAASAGFTYGWVDTCCIDKSSSAELSEAINSMYQVRTASLCFAPPFSISSATLIIRDAHILVS